MFIADQTSNTAKRPGSFIQIRFKRYYMGKIQPEKTAADKRLKKSSLVCQPQVETLKYLQRNTDTKNLTHHRSFKHYRVELALSKRKGTLIDREKHF